MTPKTLTGTVLDERIEVSISELCHACSSSTEWVIELVGEGVLEPVGDDRTEWRFSGISLRRAHAAMRLQNDLGVNLAGVALALDMLDEIEALRAKLCRFEASGRG